MLPAICLAAIFGTTEDLAAASLETDAGGRALFGRLIGAWDVRYEFTNQQGKARNDRGAAEYRWTLGGKALQEVWTSESEDQGLRPFGTTIDFIVMRSVREES
ncbi:MAG TPA: hypothetical protein VGQ22_16200 [Steroidobacteraceae bacterium]|jgi:hypothetical protein|nr:hypothetical protein [Steroidobacteraceae bacterium]